MRQTTRVLRLWFRDRHTRAPQEQAQSQAVNFIWNHSDEYLVKVWEREPRFLSGYDFQPFSKGTSITGLELHSSTIQAVAEEYATRLMRIRLFAGVACHPNVTRPVA